MANAVIGWRRTVRMPRPASPWAVAGLLLILGLCGGLRPAATAQTSALDASRLIQEQDARLGTQPGAIVLDRPGHLESSVTVGVGHALVLKAPLTVGGASIRLAGHNDVHCTAPVTVQNADDLFIADGATDLNVHGCTVKVTGRPGGYLLTATRGARVVETDNHLTNMAIFNTHNIGGAASQTTDVTIANNSTVFPPGTGPIGIYLMYVVRGSVTKNHLEGTGHGIEWWGGDANEGWHGFQAVAGAANLTITNNTCKVAGGACVWGSDGADITVSGNTADGCSDVCFDTEGGVRTTFTGNSAQGCANGCYAAEFESLNARFTNNQASWSGTAPGGILVLIKHPSGRGPSHTYLVVSGNTLSCAKLCAALYTEGEDGFTFSNNVITNGFLQFINYTNTVLIHGNKLQFTVQPPNALAAISGPTLVNGHRSEISGNSVVNQSGTSGAGPCIFQGWSDYNNADEMRIVGNTCAGFPQGIVTETAGGNPGAPRAVWYLQGNRFTGVPAGQDLVHRRRSGNETYTSVPDGGRP